MSRANSITTVHSSTSFTFKEKVAGSNAQVIIGVDGTGTDLKLFGATASAFVLWDESANKLSFSGVAELGIGRHVMDNITAKTAAYSVLAADSGTVFTTTGAAATVTFTLPVKTSGLAYWFINTVDQNMVVASNTVDTMVTFNDVAADSVAFSTASEKTGGALRVFCDGTKWIALPFGTKTTGTLTVNT